MSPGLRATCKSDLQVADENHGAGPQRLGARNCRQPVVARFATTAFHGTDATVKEFLTVQTHEKRDFQRSVGPYNLDLILRAARRDLLR